ncbi:MAG: DUF4386 domain-containing protein [Anaerolineae bacterium]|jgi:hypothetical protein
MNTQEMMDSLKRTARLAGALTLLMAVIAPFGMIYVPSTLVVPGDATATANNIIASEGLLRLGIAGNAVVFLIEIVLVVILYVLLEPVSRTFSLVAAFARLAMTTVQGVNLFNQFMALQVLGGAPYLGGFEPGQLHALALLFMNAFDSVSLIWGLFFALHLAVLGALVYRSGYIPRVVGALLIVASLCYFVQSFGTILLPGSTEIWSAIGLVSMVELAFPLWLVIKGVKGQGTGSQPAQQVRA